MSRRTRSGAAWPETARLLENPEQALATFRRSLAGIHARLLVGAAEPLTAIAILQEPVVAHAAARGEVPPPSMGVPERLVAIAELDHVHAAEGAAGVALIGRRRRRLLVGGRGLRVGGGGRLRVLT